MALSSRNVGQHSADFNDERLNRSLKQLIWVSVSGVFLDGYDISIIGLALLQVKVQFHALPWEIGLVGSAILVGNFIGALVLGRLADKVGRRSMFILNVVFFIVFAVLSGLSANITQLIVWRFLLGIGIGGDYALASPIIAEAVPASRRGRILTVNWGFAWLSGEIVSFGVGYLLLHVAGVDAWRWMLASGALPAFVVLILRRSMPESTRWLVQQGRHDEAKRVAARLHEHGIEGMIPDGWTARPTKTGISPWKELWTTYRRSTWFALLNYVFEGAPFYALSVFLPLILKTSHFAVSLTGIAKGNLIFQMSGFIGILLIYLWVDHRGRKFVNYLGFGGVLTALLVYELFFPPTPLLLFGIFVLVEAAVWLGPASTDNLFLGELWPTRVRGTGAGVAAASGRLSAMAGTFGLPILIASFGINGALWLPAIFCFLGIVNTAVLGIETKGKTLESMWGL